jgi:tryptophan synthase beta chain
MGRTKYLLNENDIPRSYYNIAADLPEPLAPVIHPGTKEPIGPEDLAPLFPMGLIEQEVSKEREIEIPDPVREAYKMFRPTPLIRALRLEQALDTPAKIYFKNESVSPAGSHKPNTAIAQAFYNQQEGVKRLSTETGAGQWGSALALAGSMFGIEVSVYMVKASFNHKPYRKSLMETWGASVVASPSMNTNAGRNILAEMPDSPGSLGIAISEAVEEAATREDTKYALGSVLNHVLLHQTVIGLETKKQLELAGDPPDIMIACIGGGSNFGGFAFPFIADKLAGKSSTRFIAVEPEAAPSLTRGKYTYDFGDTAMTTPLMKMHTLGHDFIPEPIHAGGLRYHGMAPLISHLYDLGMIEAVSVQQRPVFEAAALFARTEGILPAPESGHAIRIAIDEALKCRENGESKTIIFGLSGHGHFDLSAYDAFNANAMTDTAFNPEASQAALEKTPRLESTPRLGLMM